MKTTVTFLLFSLFSFGQSLQFNSMVATPTNNGLNINLKVTTFNGAGYLSHSYEVIDNEIFLSVCYWFNITLPVYQIETNIPILLANNQQNYTILLETFNSSSNTTCDNFSAGPTATGAFLETSKFEKKISAVNPNPFQDHFEVVSNAPIATYKITDLLGKVIVATNSKLVLDANSENLKSGVYLLEIILLDGNKQTIKLIKN